MDYISAPFNDRSNLDPILNEENYFLRMLLLITSPDMLESYISHLNECSVRQPTVGVASAYNCWLCFRGRELIKQLKDDALFQLNISFPGYYNDQKK
jgi:hypothetical protein